MSPKKRHDHDHHDHDPDHEPEGCLCDVELEPGYAVGDVDLPPAGGGVAPVSGAVLDETIDGCDLDFTQVTTADADLPAASGGVV